VKYRNEFIVPMSAREFDSKYQNIRDWPSETLYIFYKDLVDEINKQLKKVINDEAITIYTDPPPRSK
jgi:hypothetical protein